MKCRFCFSELEEEFDFCLVCGNRNLKLAGLFAESGRLNLALFGDVQRTLTFRIYGEWESLRNTFEVIWEKLHRKRADKLYLSGESRDIISETERILKLNALYPLYISVLEPMEMNEFLRTLSEFMMSSGEMEKVHLKPESKIGGAHSTIIGGREGRGLVMRIAESEFVKKIVPGVIENKGTTTGSVRLKLTRSDDRGNIRALLIHGGSVQQIHVITTARNREEGEMLIKMLRSLLH
ncbi:DUF2103 domain-containing protein [Geoglobus acetivorans]|uniref:DUF2103 domain-containing protein n=1 Tax=Geoglobus acetivorans TaxID=565033 RepID=A0ABZ3H594_GEOAI|nr:metal-binding protein [Geoglobus acetivorans]